MTTITEARTNMRDYLREKIDNELLQKVVNGETTLEQYAKDLFPYFSNPLGFIGRWYKGIEIDEEHDQKLENLKDLVEGQHEMIAESAVGGVRISYIPPWWSKALGRYAPGFHDLEQQIAIDNEMANIQLKTGISFDDLSAERTSERVGEQRPGWFDYVINLSTIIAAGSAYFGEDPASAITALALFNIGQPMSHNQYRYDTLHTPSYMALIESCRRLDIVINRYRNELKAPPS